MKKLLLCTICLVLCYSLSACKTDMATVINPGDDAAAQSNLPEGDAKVENASPEKAAETNESQDVLKETQEQDAIEATSEMHTAQDGDRTQELLQPESVGDTNYADPDKSQIPDSEESVPHSGGTFVEIPGLVPEGDLNGPAGAEYSFTTENLAELRSFFNSLDYHPYTCDGVPEYNILFDDGAIYYVNLSSRWVWQGKDEEAVLSEALLSELQELLASGQTE